MPLISDIELTTANTALSKNANLDTPHTPPFSLKQSAFLDQSERTANVCSGMSWYYEKRKLLENAEESLKNTMEEIDHISKNISILESRIQRRTFLELKWNSEKKITRGSIRKSKSDDQVLTQLSKKIALLSINESLSKSYASMSIHNSFNNESSNEEKIAQFTRKLSGLKLAESVYREEVNRLKKEIYHGPSNPEDKLTIDKTSNWLNSSVSLCLYELQCRTKVVSKLPNICRVRFVRKEA